MPAALSLIQLPSLDGLVHLCSDILLAVHGVVQHILPQLQQLPGLVGESRLLHAGAGRPRAIHKVQLRVGETHLAHLLQQRPVPGDRLTGQLQQLGANGGDAAVPPVPACPWSKAASLAQIR